MRTSRFSLLELKNLSKYNRLNTVSRPASTINIHRSFQNVQRYSEFPYINFSIHIAGWFCFRDCKC
jgi:hypothetical protein